jgi:hypothetical protein
MGSGIPFDFACGGAVRLYRSFGGDRHIARILFYIFLVIFLVLLVLGLVVFRRV